MTRAIDEAISSAIDTLERERNIRVLMAVESGSRAWGFASPDSDYDVRFVYAHRRDWYLRLAEPKDVIEAMLPGDLDLSGWDVRKALRLFADGNVALCEWLDSPIVYRERDGFMDALRATLPACYQPSRAYFHYWATARKMYAEHLAGDQVTLKKVFYCLRALLCCRWIARTLTQPPTDFARLLAGEDASTQERTWIGVLQERKTLAVEGQREPLDPAVRQWLVDAIAAGQAIGESLRARTPPDRAALDALFLSVWRQSPE
ncbi:nucleotidyltransferase domain-containing protein [Tahibacter amnicola]|uniref:Nucleotidyltransferase domain-containing protein n=1 Tax=Tahibacter amnicola TaxID=2976241 RepID=A0ABY6BH01_9GAMM|nr:nucleotidyltransferase domain-containing protein [Tahibacter amnicola]UXI69062.1 nucleotidyltransferase domain-containing protein [Tahibacter amnicola]